jgi:predicted phosphodiesterase
MKKLKCAVMSDIHFGYTDKTFQILENFLKKLSTEKIDVLFIAGDVISSKQNEFERVFKLIRRFLPLTKILYTEGNHDRWNGSPPKMPWDDKPLLGVNYNVFYNVRRKVNPYRQPKSYAIMRLDHEKIFNQFNIIHLDGNSHDLGEHIVALGFDGWYNEVNLNYLGTNDYKYLPEMIESAPVHVYLRNKAEKDLDKLLSVPTDGKTVVFMTHFPPFSESADYLRMCANPKFMDFICEKSNFFLVGHSHRQCDFIHKGCRVINAGIDDTLPDPKRRYDKPRYVVFEIEDKPPEKKVDKSDGVNE